MKNRIWMVIAVAVGSFLTGGWLMQVGMSSEGGAYQKARRFDDVLSYVSRFYVDSLGEDQLYDKATDGLLEELHDPYSVLLKDDDYKALTETTTGNYGGLGIQIDVRDGWITVVAPLPETPAEKAGVQTGDQIIAVDGKSTQGLKNDQAIKTLRGPAGSKVELTIRRPGTPDPIKLALERAVIHVRSVPPSTLFADSIGYVALNTVSETSSEEIKTEVNGLLAKGMKSLVLDLRTNPGGLLDQGVKVSDLFLDPGQEIVSTRGRARGSNRHFLDDAPQLWPTLPIVVLVNEGTASAAEIISGALQDHDRAVVIGVPTFGKGLVQTLYPLSETAALKITTARWYTPSGRTIQRVAKSQEDQIAQVERDAEGTGKPADDTSTQRFKSDAGRFLRGGGGIIPDVTIRQDSLTAGEKAFATALGSHIAEYRDALTGIALDLKNKKAITSENFTVTQAMKDDLFARLKAKGVALPDTARRGSGDLVADQLGYEIARYAFGRPAEFRRRALDDPQLQTGLKLLRKAQTPKQLIDLAGMMPSAPVKNN